MATCRRVDGGKWRCRAYVKNPDGSISRPSFTAATKAEALRMCREYEENPSCYTAVRDLTVGVAVDQYIASKSNILSPSTLVGYKTARRNYIAKIQALKIRDLSNTQLQAWVNDLSAEVSSKTVRNAYGLLVATVHQVLPGRVFRVSFPPRPRRQTHAPSEADVRALIAAASPKMRKAIVLSALYTLRRSEVCALKYADVDRDACTISVHAALVNDADYNWIYKPRPKTDGSFRSIHVAPAVIQLLGDGDPDAYVLGITPSTLTTEWYLLCDKAGVKCRYHDLRHFAASIREALGLPRSLTAETGGWNASSPVLDDIYSDTLEDRRSGYQDTLDSYFNENFLKENS